MSVCLVLALAQTGLGQTGELPEKKTEFMFLKIVHLVLLEAMVIPGADSYSNENHIITTARACSTAYVIMDGLKNHPITSRQCYTTRQAIFCITLSHNLYVNNLKCNLNNSSKVAIKPRGLSIWPYSIFCVLYCSD